MRTVGVDVLALPPLSSVCRAVVSAAAAVVEEGPGSKLCRYPGLLVLVLAGLIVVPASGGSASVLEISEEGSRGRRASRVILNGF